MRRAFNNLVSVGYSAIRIQEKISIGEGTELGPSVYIYDHDYRSGFCSNCNEELLKKSPIEIGKNCWIGANTLILRGTKLGDNCVVGGSVLSGIYPDNSLIVQKRQDNVRTY